jgi:phosphoribosyl-dephospho-CoA transferase
VVKNRKVKYRLLTKRLKVLTRRVNIRRAIKKNQLSYIDLFNIFKKKIFIYVRDQKINDVRLLAKTQQAGYNFYFEYSSVKNKFALSLFNSA